MRCRNPDPPIYCIVCRKVIGPRGGWDGPECQCNVAYKTVKSHSIRSR
jgi:hypothetical protein